MKKILITTVASASALFLAGCSSNNSSPTGETSLTLSGSANSTALEEVVVEDASGTAVATDTTDSTGAYEIEINTTDLDLKFPLVIRVHGDSGEVHAYVPKPDSLAPRHHKRVDLNDISERAFRHFEGLGDSVQALKESDWEGRLDSAAHEWLAEKDPCAPVIDESSTEAQVRDSLVATLEGNELEAALEVRMEMHMDLCLQGLPPEIPEEFRLREDWRPLPLDSAKLPLQTGN